MLGLNKFSLRNFDWPLVIAVMLLVALGLAATYSVDLSRGIELINFKKQLIALTIGVILFFAASLSQRTIYQHVAKLSYWLSLVALCAVLFFGKNIRGTTGWFVFGNFSFQPVELAKVGLILMLAYIISNFGRRFERPLFFFGTGAVTLVMIVLVMLQPDLGSAGLLGSIWFGLMFLTGARRSFILLLISGLVVGSVLAWFFFLQNYQKARILTFVDPQRDPLHSGYNVAQSMIAIGSGQFFGRGLGFGSQNQLRFLPEAQTDFVFSVIAEELGFAGAGILVVLFGVVIWRILLLARSTDDDFVAATAVGVVVLFFAQFVFNVGANIGLVPVTGVTLPFVSYGGSSLIINLLLVGILESMVARKY